LRLVKRDGGRRHSLAARQEDDETKDAPRHASNGQALLSLLRAMSLSMVSRT
jgi:hypothetical protein